MSAITGLLQGARYSELCRGVQRIQLERVPKRVNRLRKLLELRINCTQEIPGVGITVINRDDALEIFNRGLRVSAVFVQHPQRVPDMRIFWISFRCCVKNVLSRLDPRQ